MAEMVVTDPRALPVATYHNSTIIVSSAYARKIEVKERQQAVGVYHSSPVVASKALLLLLFLLLTLSGAEFAPAPSMSHSVEKCKYWSDARS